MLTRGATNWKSRALPITAAIAAFSACGFVVFYWQTYQVPKVHWQGVVAADTITAYERFIENSTDELRKGEAQARLEELRQLLQSMVEARDRAMLARAKMLQAVDGVLARKLDTPFSAGGGADSHRAAAEHARQASAMQHAIIREHVLGGDRLAGLDGELSRLAEAGTAIRHEDAVIDYRSIQKGFEQLQQAVAASRRAGGSYANAAASRRAWHAALEEARIERFPRASDVERLYVQAESKLADLELQDAAETFDSLAERYGDLVSLVAVHDDARSSAYESQQSWQGLAERHELSEGIGSSAGNGLVKAEDTWKLGEVVTAGGQFETASEEYVKLQQRASAVVGVAQAAMEMREHLASLAAKNGFGLPGDMRQRDRAYEHGWDSLRKGEFDQAMDRFSAVRSALANHRTAAESLVSSIDDCQTRREEWLSTVSAGWARKWTGAGAEALLDEARRSGASGEYAAASSMYRRAKDEYSALVSRAGANRDAHAHAVGEWESGLTEIESKIREIEVRVARHRREMDAQESLADRECPDRGFPDTLVCGYVGSCDKTVYIAGIPTRQKDLECIWRCEQRIKRAADRQMQAAIRCEQETERARDAYRRAWGAYRDANEELGRTKSELEAARRDQPMFEPI